jgi:hypothetical protein
LCDAFAGTVQRALDGLTSGMTALLTTARRPIPVHVAIAKVSDAPFLLNEPQMSDPIVRACDGVDPAPQRG